MSDDGRSTHIARTRLSWTRTTLALAVGVVGVARLAAAIALGLTIAVAVIGAALTVALLAAVRHQFPTASPSPGPETSGGLLPLLTCVLSGFLGLIAVVEIAFGA